MCFENSYYYISLVDDDDFNENFTVSTRKRCEYFNLRLLQMKNILINARKMFSLIHMRIF